MLDNSVLAGEVIRHGAYVCLRLASSGDARALAAVAIPALAEKLGLENEFTRPAAPASIAYVRRIGATPADIADDGLLHADAVVHVAQAIAQLVEIDACRVGELASLGAAALQPSQLTTPSRSPARK